MKDNEEMIHYEKEVNVKVVIQLNFALDDISTETWDENVDKDLMAKCRELVKRDLSNGFYTEQFFIDEIFVQDECLLIRSIPKERKPVSSVVEFLEGDMNESS